MTAFQWLCLATGVVGTPFYVAYHVRQLRRIDQWAIRRHAEMHFGRDPDAKWEEAP